MAVGGPIQIGAWLQINDIREYTHYNIWGVFFLGINNTVIYF